MTVYEITFSPTGGTGRASRGLCAGISSEIIRADLCSLKPAPESLCFMPEDVCVVAVPSFAGRVPATAAERIRRLKGNGARAVPVVVYGNRAYDDTLIELYDLLTECGFRCAAAVTAIAEHSILRQFAAGRPNADDLDTLKRFGQEIARRIADGTADADISVPGNRPYRALSASALKPEVSASCSGCGTCAVACPVSAIPADSPAQTNTDQCISCMRCISICPSGARTLNADTLAILSQRLAPALGGHKENELFI